MTIDWWTLGLQTVNVAVLVWLLQRFFWTPVSGMIEQRRAAAQVILSDAEAKRAQATAALADIGKTRAGFALEGEAIRSAAHAAAEQDRTTCLAAATKAAADLEAVARATIAKEREANEAAAGDRASGLAVEIAGHLAARLEGPAVGAAFLQWLVEAIEALPDSARHAAGVDDAAFTVISATPIAATDEARYRQRIGIAFAATPHITFAVDPAIIAGLELHGRTLLVTNSWRADLARIRTDLMHDAQP